MRLENKQTVNWDEPRWNGRCSAHMHHFNRSDYVSFGITKKPSESSKHHATVPKTSSSGLCNSWPSPLVYVSKEGYFAWLSQIHAARSGKAENLSMIQIFLELGDGTRFSAQSSILPGW